MKKVILITGASSGMGKDCALALIKQGHIVYGAARRTALMQDLLDAGGHAIELDITQPDSINHAVNRIMSEQGRIDVLFNNAGYAIYGAVEDITIEEARNQFEVNLFGLAAITQAVVPLMRAQNKGLIINTSSMGGKIYTPLGAWYHASKHALEGWSDCLRLELKQFGIHVVVLEPGVIATEFGDVLLEPMLKRSKAGAYADLANALAKALQRSYEQGDSSPATVISNVVTKIVTSAKPKTRYVVGKHAKPLMWLRKYGGDRIFDKIIMGMAK